MLHNLSLIQTEKEEIGRMSVRSEMRLILKDSITFQTGSSLVKSRNILSQKTKNVNKKMSNNSCLLCV